MSEYDYVKEKFLALKAQEMAQALMRWRRAHGMNGQLTELSLRSVCYAWLEESWDAGRCYVMSNPSREANAAGEDVDVEETNPYLLSGKDLALAVAGRQAGKP